MKVYERERDSCGSVMADPPHIRSLFLLYRAQIHTHTHIRSQPLLCKATPNPTHPTWEVTSFTFLLSLSLLLFHPRSKPPHIRSHLFYFLLLCGASLCHSGPSTPYNPNSFTLRSSYKLCFSPAHTMPSTPIYSAYNNAHFLGIFCRPANPQTNAFSSVLSRLQCRAMCDSWFKHWPPPLPYVAGAGEAHRKLTPVTKKGPNRCFHRRNPATVSTFPPLVIVIVSSAGLL